MEVLALLVDWRVEAVEAEEEPFLSNLEVVVGQVKRHPCQCLLDLAFAHTRLFARMQPLLTAKVLPQIPEHLTLHLHPRRSPLLSGIGG